MSRSFLILVVALGVLAFVPAGSGAEVVGKTIEISQEIYDERGDPSLVANASPVGGKPLTWERCAPFSSTCEVVQGDDGVLEPGEAAPGTTFRVRRADVANPEVVTSHPWGGRVTLTRAPYATGELREMARIVPSPGVWSGGWGGDTDTVTVFACKYRSSKRCDVVTGAWYPSGDQPVNRPIGPRYIGWRLFVASYRNPSDSFWADIGLGRTRTSPLTRADASVAVVELGRVANDPKYSFRLLRRTHLDRNGRMAIAKVRCPDTCKVQINAGSPSPYEFYSYQSTWIVKSSGTLRIPGTFYKQRRASVSLAIKDALAAEGVVRISK